MKVRIIADQYRDIDDNQNLLVDLDQRTIDTYFIPHDIQRLESYTRNQIEYRLVLDLTTDIATLVFQGKMSSLQIDTLQKVRKGFPLYYGFILQKLLPGSST